MAKIKSRDLRVSPKNKEVLIESAYELFLRSRKSRCSQATIRIYTEKQKNIVDDFSRVGVEYISAINAPSIRAVIADYQDTHSYNGAWKLFTVIRTFLLWYWDEYELADCPIRKVKVKKPAYQPKQGISRADIDKLISAVKRSSKFPERDICLILMLADTGLR